MALTSKRIDWSKVFPHTCKIYSLNDGDEFEETEKYDFKYIGDCRDEGSSNIRSFSKNNVNIADHVCYIPVLLKGVTNDCRIDITTQNEKITERQITSCQSVYYGDREGTAVFYNEAKN